MNAYELLKPDLSPSGIWVCKTCGQKYSGDEVIAAGCCDPRCKTCGGPGRKHYITCESCSAKRQAEAEAANFARAEKVEGWDGWVWTDATSHNEGFFSDIESLIEWFDEADEDNDGSKPVLPSYAWICEPTAFVQLSLDRILEGIEEDDDAFEDCRDRFKGVKELGDAIKAFNEANKEVVSYHPCSNRVVLIHSEPRP